MLMHPQIDPVALQLGPVAIHWYGLTYLAAFGLFLFLGSRRLRHAPDHRPLVVRRGAENLALAAGYGGVPGDEPHGVGEEKGESLFCVAYCYDH